MKIKILNSILFLFFLLVFANAQDMPSRRNQNITRSYLDLPWRMVATGLPDEWYGSDDSKIVAENILLYQRPEGGWPKNMELHRPLSEEQKDSLQKNSSSYMQTFDNNATTTEMKFMARMYNNTKDVRYRNSFLRGFECLLKAQYPNGGWPQYYPLRNGYYLRITYNDNCMINIMEIIRDVMNREPLYSQITTTDDAEKAKIAYDNGLDCILKSQIKVNEQPTVWCAQHDENNLLPAGARSYELPSFSGGESVGVLLFLMTIPNPSKEVVASVNGAVEWFEKHKIEGIRVEQFINADGQRDRRVVTAADEAAWWARFYDLETEKPFFCGRDGVKREKLSEIELERRRGYSWYTREPQKALDKYQLWSEKFNK